MLALLHGRRNPVRVSGLLRFRFEPAVMAQILRIGVPNSLENSFFQLGRVLLVSLISTFGTALGVGAKAGFLDEDGNLPGIDKVFKVDAVATALAACSACRV